jgi:hypothetical protein
MVGEVWRRRPKMRPDVLLRLVSELDESAHISASHPPGRAVTRPWS